MERTLVPEKSRVRYTKKKVKIFVPPVGIEPTTTRSRVLRSALLS